MTDWNKIIKNSKELMKQQTNVNQSPAWALTEMAVEKGKILADKYKVDKNIVTISLYLAHTVFNQTKKSDIRKNHPKLSADFIKPYLNKWNIPIDKQEIIINSIEAHHNQVPTNTLTAEVVKNAECFKFVTVKGSLIFLHELGRRGLSYEQSVFDVLEKVDQKLSFLTFPECIKEAKENIKVISSILKET